MYLYGRKSVQCLHNRLIGYLKCFVNGLSLYHLRCHRREGIEPQVIVCKVDDDGRYEISDVVNQLMSQDEMPTAIACQEDGIALPLMFQLERNGFSVPGDVSLIGYDDSFYTGDIGLTTIRQDPVEMARVAARMALDLIDEKPIEQPYIVFPAQLKVRSSTSRVK